MSRFLDIAPTLRSIVSKYNGDVKAARREFLYENKRDKRIGPTDALKLLNLAIDIEKVDSGSSEARTIVTDGDAIISRTSIDQYL